jgi:hypothetical protein
MMRSVVLAALLGAAWFLSPAMAQSSEDSRPSKSHKGRTPTAADSLIENGPERPHALEEVRREAEERKAKVEKPVESSSTSAPPPPPVVPTVQAVPPGPPQKNLTGDEFRAIRVGSTAKEVLAVLGPPASRVVVPDDDGHTRETLQYWVHGAPMGTVRLDNGRVVQIETRQK